MVEKVLGELFFEDFWNTESGMQRVLDSGENVLRFATTSLNSELQIQLSLEETILFKNGINLP